MLKKDSTAQNLRPIEVESPQPEERTSADMQHSKVRKGISVANLNYFLLWEYNYSAAQKAIAQRPRFISAVEFSIFVSRGEIKKLLK